MIPNRSVQHLERKTAVAPCRQPTGKRSNARYAHPPESLRHPGACGFVWSGAVENHLFIAGNVTFLFQNLGQSVESAGNPEAIDIHVELVAEIEHKNIPVRVHDPLQL